VIRAPAGGRPAPAGGYPWHAAHAPAGTGPSAQRQDIQGHRAGAVTRLLAAALDLGVVLLVLVTGYLAVSAVRFLWKPAAFRFPAPAFELVLILGAAVCTVYLALFWSLTGRTYGATVLGIRVVDERGRSLRPLVASARAALCVLVPIGLLWVLVSAQNRSAQDVLLRTSVVHDWTAH
jgi:uncharacterized RDD family membrane protein YckC